MKDLKTKYQDPFTNTSTHVTRLISELCMCRCVVKDPNVSNEPDQPEVQSPS